MKKIFLNYVIVLICIAHLSCSKNFLDVPVQGAQSTASDPALAQKLVTGVYHSLLQGESFGNGDVHGFAYVSATDIMSDDADKGSFRDDQITTAGAMDEFNTLTPTNTLANSLWAGHYNSIGAANQALAALTTASIDGNTKNKLKAEVLFLRGYIYFNLVRMFGGVPLILRVPKDAKDANTDSAFQTRVTANEIYASIEKDLQYAIDSLPEKPQAEVGHASRGAAKSLLAKVYMYEKNWPKVFELTNDVINSNQYDLADDYAVLSKQAGDNNIESIFEVETGSFNNANLGVANYINPQGVRVGGKGGWDDLGWGFCDPSLSLIKAYEPGDIRKDATIIFIDSSGTHKGTVLWDGFRIPSSDSVENKFYNYKAYTSKTKETYADVNDKNRPKNIKILRYAEVLLMNAEAALQPSVNQPSQAETNLNLVRKRANLPPKSGITISDVWQERRVELAMEHDRFWDLVRQGRAATVMQASGKAFVAGKNELLPIPSSQIQLSGGKLKQNPGY